MFHGDENKKKRLYNIAPLMHAVPFPFIFTLFFLFRLFFMLFVCISTSEFVTELRVRFTGIKALFIFLFRIMFFRSFCQIIHLPHYLLACSKSV